MSLLASHSTRCPSGLRGPARSDFHGSTAALRAASRKVRPNVQRQASAALVGTGEEVPSPEKRAIMNWILLGSASLTTAGLAFPYIAFFVPPSVGGSGDAIPAKDAQGNDVKASSWVKSHRPGDRSLTQGLKSDATYLIVNDKSEIEKYGLNAVCTHLGCVVPWNNNENKFKCPCHGSQYNSEGKVVRGPAPLSLALAHADIKDDVVFFSPWKEKDFRTNTDPWWS